MNYTRLPSEEDEVDTARGRLDRQSAVPPIMISDPVSYPNYTMSSGKRSPNYGSLEPISVVVSTSENLRNRKKIPRAITKAGDIGFSCQNIERHNWKFLEDGFTSVLELRWRYVLLAFCLSYLGSWAIFAWMWWAILYFHGDLDNFGDPNWTPCITGINGFASAFLFSVETQHTTGFGYYHLGDKCPDAMILLCIQSIFGVILEGLMVGAVFVKMSRAKKRSATLMFSRNALISLRDGIFYLMIRVGDMRTKSHLLEAHVRAQFVSKKTTREGEVIKYHQQELEIGGDGEKDGRILLFWPTIVVHKIDSSSPLYKVCPSELTAENSSFEIIVILEGINESTGLSAQARSSYLPSEIIWGQRFQDLHSAKDVASGSRVVDYGLFHKAFPVKTPNLSAAEYEKQGGNVDE